MSDFPKWMLALAGINLIPVLICPFFLFGIMPFGTSTNGFVNFLLYLATQLLWIVPLALFFISLDYYRRGFEKTGITFALIGLSVTVWALLTLMA